MKRVHIVGRKNSGKTTLVVELVEHLCSQGYRIGTIKHTHHHHQLDTPGKDSHRHGEAGAAVVGILTPGATAVFQPTDKDPPQQCRYSAMAPMFAQCDLVLVEGDLQADAPKIEVWRAALMDPPIAAADPSIRAIVSDDSTDVQIPGWKRSEISVLATNILRLADPANESPR